MKLQAMRIPIDSKDVRSSGKETRALHDDKQWRVNRLPESNITVDICCSFAE